MRRASRVRPSLFCNIVEVIEITRCTVLCSVGKPAGRCHEPGIPQNLPCEFRIGCLKAVGSLCFSQLISEVSDGQLRADAHGQQNARLIAVCAYQKRNIKRPRRRLSQQPAIDERIDCAAAARTSRFHPIICAGCTQYICASVRRDSQRAGGCDPERLLLRERSRGKQVDARLHNGSRKQSGCFRHREQRHGTHCAGGFPENGDLRRVTAKGSDVLLHPAKCCQLVHQSEITERSIRGRFIRQSRMRKVTEWAEAIVDRHDDHALPGELCSIENRERSGTDHMRATMNPNHHSQARRALRPPDVQLQTVFRLDVCHTAGNDSRPQWL